MERCENHPGLPVKTHRIKNESEVHIMKNLMVAMFLVLFVSACSDQVKPDEESFDGSFDNQPSGVEVGSVDNNLRQMDTMLIDGIQRKISYEKDAIYDIDNVLSERTIYFDFDSSTIADKYQEVLKHHGKYLALNSSASLRVEGHTDERGTREYNVALADRRAQAVKRLILFQGASDNQILVISYGEEKPVAMGHDENVWQLNRRAELVYGEE